MRRKIWIIISILTALISGMFLYEGGKIFFLFRDRRGGLTVLIAGILVLVLFVRGVWRSIRLDEEYISREEARLLLMFAFTADIVGHVNIGSLQERIRLLVEKRLRHGNAKCDGCAICK